MAIKPSGHGAAGNPPTRALIQARIWMHTGSDAALAQAIAAPLVALGFAIYYRSLAKRWGK